MNENESLEFDESSKKVAQKIDEEIDGIRTKVFKENPMLDVGDQALLEKLKKKIKGSVDGLCWFLRTRET